MQLWPPYHGSNPFFACVGLPAIENVRRICVRPPAVRTVSPVKPFLGGEISVLIGFIGLTGTD